MSNVQTCLIFFKKKRENIGPSWGYSDVQCPNLFDLPPGSEFIGKRSSSATTKLTKGRSGHWFLFFWVKRWYMKKMVWRKTNDCPIKKNWVQVLRKVEKEKQLSLPQRSNVSSLISFFEHSIKPLMGHWLLKITTHFFSPHLFFFTISLMHCMSASYSFFICHP